MSQAEPGPGPKNAGITHNVVMNDDLIYCKTPDGERALVQRTRLVQRNLRNVLILVDGVASVADLTRKLGDGSFLRASLAELVRGGFVETIEENRVRHGLESATGVEDEPNTAPAPAIEDTPVSLPPQLESVSAVGSQEEQQAEPSEAPPLSEPVVADEPPAYVRRQQSEPFWRRWNIARKPVAASANCASAAAEALDLRRTEQEIKPVKVRIKPIRRGVASRPRWRWWAQTTVALLVLVACLFVALVVFPYDRFRPEIQERATAWLGRPVTVGEIRFALMPQPGITLERVRVGGEQGVVLGTVRGLPSPFSLLGDRWRVGTVVLERPLIDERAIQALLDPRRLPSRDSIGVMRVAIEGATVSIAGMGLEDVSGAIELRPEGGIDEIELRTKDGNLRLTAAPKAESSMKLTLNGAGWRMPWRGGLPIDSIEAEGLLERKALRIDNLGLRTLGGTITGSASVDWPQQVALSVQANLVRVNLQRLLALLEPALRAQGDLSGKFALRANAPSLEAAGRAIYGGGSFSLERASLDGFDLVEAVRTRSENPIRGGTTKLEDFAGSISVDSNGWRLSGLRGSSGVLSTSGYLRQAGGKVDGIMDVQLRGSANQVNVPVMISGNLADPMLSARRRAVAPLAVDSGQGAEDGRAR